MTRRSSRQAQAGTLPIAIVAPLIAAGAVGAGAFAYNLMTPPKAEESVLTRPSDQVCERYAQTRTYKAGQVGSFDLAGIRLGMEPAEVQDIMLCAGMKLNYMEHDSCAQDWITHDRAAHEFYIGKTKDYPPEASKNCITRSTWYEDQRSVRVEFVEDVTDKRGRMNVYDVSTTSEGSRNEASRDAYYTALISKYGKPTIDLSSHTQLTWGTYTGPELTFLCCRQYSIRLTDQNLYERLKKMRSKVISDAKPTDKPKL